MVENLVLDYPAEDANLGPTKTECFRCRMLDSPHKLGLFPAARAAASHDTGSEWLLRPPLLLLCPRVIRLSSEGARRGAKQWAVNPRVEWCRRWNVKKALRTLEEVELHREDVRHFMQWKDERIEEACKPDSVLVLFVEDYITAYELAREKDALNSSAASAWATCVGFRFWCRGRTPDNPYRFQVFSEDCAHDAHGGHQALNEALEMLPEIVKITMDILDGITDRGGHFGAKAFVGGVLWQVARRFTIKEVRINGSPCYHGKNGVDGDGRPARPLPSRSPDEK